MSSLFPENPGTSHGHDDPVVDEELKGSDRRRLVLVGLAAVVVLVAVAGFLYLHRGGSSDAVATGAVPHAVVQSPRTASSPVPSPSRTSHKKSKVPKVEHKSIVRDPFTPLVADVSSGSSSGSAGTSATSAGGTASAAGGTSAGTPTTGQSTGSSTSSASSPAQTGPQWVQLVAAHGTRSATIRVGYPHHQFKSFTVLAPPAGSQSGTSFDGDFALFAVSAQAATIQIGDATPIALSEGTVQPVS